MSYILKFRNWSAGNQSRKKHNTTTFIDSPPVSLRTWKCNPSWIEAQAKNNFIFMMFFSVRNVLFRRSENISSWVWAFLSVKNWHFQPFMITSFYWNEKTKFNYFFTQFWGQLKIRSISPIGTTPLGFGLPLPYAAWVMLSPTVC